MLFDMWFNINNFITLINALKRKATKKYFNEKKINCQETKKKTSQWLNNK